MEFSQRLTYLYEGGKAVFTLLGVAIGNVALLVLKLASPMRVCIFPKFRSTLI